MKITKFESGTDSFVLCKHQSVKIGMMLACVEAKKLEVGKTNKHKICQSLTMDVRIWINDFFGVNWEHYLLGASDNWPTCTDLLKQLP